MNRIAFAAKPGRLQRFEEGVRKDYDHSTIVREALEYREASSYETGDFIRIGLRFYANADIFIDEYASPGTYVSPEIIGLGRSIAIGEEKFLISQIEKVFRTKKVNTKVELKRFLEGLPELRPISAFVPIDYYTDLHLSKDPSFCISYENGASYLLVGSKKARVFWSNKYVKFDKFYFIGKGSLQWIVKPDPEGKHWVRVGVIPDAISRRFDVTTEIIACLKVLDNELGLVMSLGEPPKP